MSGRVYPHIAELLQASTSPEERTLEIGGGASQYRPFVQGSYWSLDLHSDYYGGRVDIYGDALDLPLATASVDRVFMVAVLLTIEDADRALAESERVLRPGGSITVFDYGWWPARRLLKQGAHYHAFSSFGLRRRLRRLGLQTTIHFDCVPPLLGQRFPRALRPLLYPFTVWAVVTGTKPG